ncbi:hypothetical protein [Lacrimispora sp.]|uniref:hypothetical protein n=1 Tax=Lacrimispora sp. TaxID=2719234 RepID=UPI00289BFBE4|nr:hypothetical protein [Lacrimispora sp.]
MDISESIIGGVFAIVGTVLGWLLTLIATNSGKIHVSINDSVCKHAGGAYTISFEVVVFNNKRDKCGLNNCKVILVDNDGGSGEFIPMFTESENMNEFDKLLNIDAKTIKKARYHQTSIEYSKSRYYFQYIINGKKKKIKVPIFNNK